MRAPKVTDRVRLRGLSKRLDLNGLSGVVDEYVDSTGRFGVRLDDAEGTVFVKEQNLALWPEVLLSEWHEAGGLLTFAALEAVMPVGPSRTDWFDSVGAGLPVRHVPVLKDSARVGAWGAAESGDHGFFELMAARIAQDGWVVVDLFGDASAVPFKSAPLKARQEAIAIWPEMKEFGPTSPSGAPRGDRGIFLEDAKQLKGEASCKTLHGMNEVCVLRIPTRVPHLAAVPAACMPVPVKAAAY